MSASAWLSVRRHGLLSTRRLVDLFGLDAVPDILDLTDKIEGAIG
jgi:hypothetical protein